MSIEFNNDQIHALYKLENWWYKSDNQLFQIAGGPGTGKTTLIKYFIERMNLKYSNVAFIAFMGKAAMEMARHGLPAQTFHSFTYKYEKVLDLDEDGNMQFTASYKPKMKSQFVLREEPSKKVDLIVLDEVSMINEQMAKDILSFDIPIIVLGDLDQLDPIFGKPFFLQNPDVILTQIMRQAEDSPIIYLSQRVKNDLTLQTGVYGTSAVIDRSDLNEFMLRKADVVLTTTNKIRDSINTLYRENIYNIQKLDFPSIGEKIVCRRNNWDRCLNESIYLTNGMAGTVDYMDMSKFNGKTITFDFKPDFLNKPYKNLKVDYVRMMSSLSSENNTMSFGMDVFEFAYGITVHMSQGSQYDNVIFLNQRSGFDNYTFKKIQHTAITRAKQSIIIVK